VAVCLFSWWACGASYAVDFPSLPLQTGTSQVPPNIIFILDDSLSMTSSGGDALDTRLVWCTNATCPNQPQLGPDSDSEGAGAPYTKNPLSYNPDTVYKPWAYANNTDTSVLDRGNASYTAASKDLQLYTGGAGSIDLSASVQTYYVPKPSTTQTNRHNYYRYQILTGTPGKVVRAEWTNTDNSPPMSAGSNWTNETANADRWTNSGGSNNTSNSRRTYTVPAGATRVVIATSGTLGSRRDPGIYVNVGAGAYPNRSSPTYSMNAAGGNTHETLTINNPTAGDIYQIGVFNHGSNNIGTGFNITVTYTTSTAWLSEVALGCTVHASNYGWKNCTDVSAGEDLATTKVRAVAAEKQNYANWYQYHRTRMKTAKAGGSEAFAALDENYRVGLMGLYPSGNYQQVAGGTTGGAAPAAGAPGNLNNIIPVDTNGGLFIEANRKTWFDRFHAMTGKQYTPLRKALDAAGKYFTSARAYKSTVGTDTTYLACRQNFTILTTDGYWNNWSGDDDPDSNYSDAKISGDEEDGLVIKGPGKDDFQYEAAAPYWYDVAGSDRSDTTTLADIAMHYWKTDLRTSDGGHAGSADNKVPTSGSNPAFWQHMVTFGVGLGVRGKLTDAEVAKAVGNLPGGYWPAPVHAENATENPENVDDLRHAAVNGRGSFINANDSTEFASGIKDALGRISERRGSASNVLANSTSISTESFIYQATYTAGAWRGELLAYPISATEGLGEADWYAGELMAAWDSRKIFTASAVNTGSTFPSTTQETSLGTAATLLDASLTGTDLANYLKGDGRKEQRNTDGVLRNRAVPGPTANTFLPRVLGDIVDSSPFYVGDTKTVFVGANDGMLHAFDASNSDANADHTSGGGTERFAYVPLGVSMSDMADLADPLYGTNTATKPHRFFVDGPIVVSSRTRTPGKNYLVGALGRGGRGVFGLDVTNPGSFSTGSVLWDRTGAPPDNMGNVISEPLISKLKTGVTAAVVANGPNSATGTASLFILNLDTGATIYEFDTGTTGNGLSAPRAVDVNADGMVDFFFAGDLLGNLWRFNVSDASMSNWTKSKVFVAQDASSNPQPISSAPGVARDPSNGNIWVFFGTGRYITSDDQASVSTQTYYGILVGTAGTDGSNLSRINLDQRSIQVIDADGRRAFEAAEIGIEAGKNGWYIDLNDPPGKGERVISAPLLYNNILVFSSIVPPSASTVNSCDAGGSGYVNALDAFSGTGLNSQFFTGVPLIEDGDDELPVGSLPINAGMPTAPIIIGDQLVVGDSSGGKPTDETVNAPGGGSTKRVSWREVVTQ
jgi:type IV pilus assembly protein PilY1